MRELGDADEVAQSLGLLVTDVDAALRHDGERQRMQVAGHRAGAVRLEGLACQGAQQGFGHLAAGAVGAGEEEDFLDHVCLLRRDLDETDSATN